jgi:hydroxymethylpyrimidine pyrophosphatase-like HAD family hydrolase
VELDGTLLNSEWKLTERNRQAWVRVHDSSTHLDFELVDIVAEGADKGSGLFTLARILSVAPGQIMAIGDNYADSTMLEVARHPVVMGNAPTKLRQK